MFLTKEQVMNFPSDCYLSTYAIRIAISDRYACGISDETAARIIKDYHKNENKHAK